MANYKADNLWFNSITELSGFPMDSSDADGLVFAVGENATDWGWYAWRKSSVAAIDNATIFAANGPGRWVRLGSTTASGTLTWSTITMDQWANITMDQWASIKLV